MTVQVEQEANITMASILGYLEPPLKGAEEAGMKVLVRRGKEVVRWKEFCGSFEEDVSGRITDVN